MFKYWPLAKRSLFLGVIGLLMPLMAACASQPQITLHANYDYNHIQAPPGAAYQESAGYYEVYYEDQISVIWEPSSDGERLMDAPIQVTLSAKLVGPFASLEAMKQAVSVGGIDGPVVAAAPPLHTDSWTNKTRFSFLPLPTRLAAGYYELVEDFCKYGRWYYTSAGEVGGVYNGCYAEGDVPLYIAR